MTNDREVIAMRLHNGRHWWIGLLGAYVAALTIMAGLAVSGAFPDTGTSNSRPHGGSAHTAQSEQDRAMLARHQHMQEQMRLDTSPQMLDNMNADPMWDQMRNAEYTTMLEDQQDEIDRMLGKGAP